MQKQSVDSREEIMIVLTVPVTVLEEMATEGQLVLTSSYISNLYLSKTGIL